MASGLFSGREYKRKQRLAKLAERKPNIHFRNRPLERWEKSKWYCDKCGADVPPNMISRHKCVT